jgi:GntR family transcriptional regulator
MSTDDTPSRLDSRPLYLRVEEAVRDMIERGAYAVDQQLPSEERLAAAFGVSRPTIRMALGRLESLGLVKRQQGGGTFVTRRKPAVLDMGLETILSLHPRLSTLGGLQSHIADLDICRLEADRELAQQRSVAVGPPVARVSRIVMVDSEPAAYLCDYIPESVVTLAELQASFVDSVLDFFARLGSPQLLYTKTDISIYYAEPGMAACLSVEEGEPLFQLDEGLYAAGDKVVDWSHNFFVPRHFRFHVVRRVVG